LAGTTGDFVFPSRINYVGHLSTRQYARLGSGLIFADRGLELGALFED
jgi:hypothetical protein